MSKRRRFFNKNSDDDPLAGMVNLTDAMLVLAVGFLIFTVMSMNMQSVIFNDLDPQEKKELSETIKNTVAVKTGKSFNGSVGDASSGDSDMEQMGTVYKDPATGKLIMIPPTDQK